MTSTDDEQTLNLFPESKILIEQLQSVLNEMYGNIQQSWNLIYRASDHDFSAEAFHKHCDNIAPLLVVALVRKINFREF